ncbi:MAG: T9SS type A sorting domain-containing protein [Vicingaceae bacterium]
MLHVINRLSALIISIIITSTLSANTGQSIKTKSTTNLNNSISCTIEYFKVMEINGKLYFKYLILENKDNVAYVLESSENGNEYNFIQIKEGVKSPNKNPLLYCFSEKLIENTSYRVKRISFDGLINYSGSITINKDHQSKKWIHCLNDGFSKIASNLDTQTCNYKNIDNIALEMKSIDIVSNISIYPNPNNGLVNINFGNLKNISIRVLNIYGQLVFQENNINNDSYQFELNEIPGIYFLDIDIHNHHQRFTLVKK